MGRSPLTFDGEELLELRSDSLIRRDAKLGEVAHVPLANPQSLALLVDRSVIVLAGDRVHHIVRDKVDSSTESRAKLVLASSSPKVYWEVSGTTVKRTEIGTTSARVDFFLPENAAPMTAQALRDGSLVLSDAEGLLRIDRTLATYAWDIGAEFLAAGPDADTVWSAHSSFESLPSRLVLRHLEKGTAKPRVTHRLAPGEEFVHASSAGTDAAAIVARSTGANEAALTLIVFDERGERWRAPLGDRTGGYFVAVSQGRVVVLGARGSLRAWNRETGKPV